MIIPQFKIQPRLRFHWWKSLSPFQSFDSSHGGTHRDPAASFILACFVLPENLTLSSWLALDTYYGPPFWFPICGTNSFPPWLWKVRNLLFFLLFNYKSLFEQPLWQPVFKQAFVIENRACNVAAGTPTSKEGDVDLAGSWSPRPLSKGFRASFQFNKKEGEAEEEEKENPA